MKRRLKREVFLVLLQLSFFLQWSHEDQPPGEVWRFLRMFGCQYHEPPL